VEESGGGLVAVSTTEAIDAKAEAASARAARAGKYLTFHLAAEEYGLEILKVREIIGLMKITKIPQSPAYIRGVINLRGKVIPVLDLRLRFGMEAIGSGTDTAFILGVAKIKNDVKILLDIDRVFDETELASVVEDGADERAELELAAR
jgi:purine-binding chemotaxis protein CheW